MKPWIKPAGLGLFGAVALFGGLAAWAHSHQHEGGWRSMMNMSDDESQSREQQFIARAATMLKLDDAQKAKLNALALALREQRKALVAPGSDSRSELQSLVAGSSFDRVKASALVDSKVGAVNLRSPAVITAAADFYDSLKPEQQAQVRDFMAKRQRFGQGGERGEQRHGERQHGERQHGEVKRAQHELHG